MAWLMTHMWAVLAGAGVLGLLLGWAFRGMLLKGKATKALVERDVAQTELEQARTEIDGLYAAQRTSGAVANGNGNANYAAELKEREAKLAELTQQLADSKGQLAKLKEAGGGTAAAVVAGVVGAAGGAAVTKAVTQTTVAQDEQPSLVWRNRHLESRVRTLETKIHDMAAAPAASVDAAAAGAAGVVAGGVVATAVGADAETPKADTVELDKMRFKNTELQQRLDALEDQIVEQTEEDTSPAQNADGDSPEEELARLRWRNRYLEGRLAYYEGDEEGAEDVAGAVADAVEINDESDTSAGLALGAVGALGAGLAGAAALAGDAAGDTADTIESASDGVEDTVESVADAIAETAEDTMDAVTDSAADTIDTASDFAETSVETVTETATELTADATDIADTAQAEIADVAPLEDEVSVDDIKSGLKDMVTDGENNNLIAGRLTGDADVQDISTSADVEVEEIAAEGVDAFTEQVELSEEAVAVAAEDAAPVTDLPSMDDVDAEMAELDAGEEAEAAATEADTDVSEAETEAPEPEVEEAPTAAMTQPLRLDGPVSGQPDDLTVIGGVGPKIQEVLNGLGVYHYDQIADWSGENVAWVDDYMNFSGRIGREDWVGQAKVLSGADVSA